jgi:hypothetical protein
MTPAGNGVYNVTCETTEFNPDTITVNYGDGTQESLCYGCGVYQDGLTHTYTQNGTYTPWCALNTFEWQGIKRAEDSITLVVGDSPGTNNQTNQTNNTNQSNQTISVSVKEPYPKGTHYVFVCEAESNTYRWDFGDGSQQTGYEDTVYHVYGSAGAKTVTCVTETGAGSLSINVQTESTGGQTNNSNQTNTTARTFDLYVKAWYPKDNDYVFVCSTPDMTPDSYNWFYGDGEKLLNIQNGDTYHRYKNTGTYTVTCEAHENGQTLTDALTVTVNTVSNTGSQTNSTGNATNNSNQTTCYNDVRDMPASCPQGVLLQDYIGADGCRYFQCGRSGQTLTVQACNKPGNNDIQYFDMSTSNDRGSDIFACLADQCLHTYCGYDNCVNSRYDKGDIQFPVCPGTDNSTQPPQNNTNATNSTNLAPEVVIFAPHNGARTTDAFNFLGQAVDPEDGTLIDQSLNWYSDVQGFLGWGTGFSRSLDLGTHTITLIATDSQGLNASNNIIVYVDNASG